MHADALGIIEDLTFEVQGDGDTVDTGSEPDALHESRDTIKAS